ncbi:MAG: polyketide synthase dehydratase domain-containing protein [Desulfoarculaceae bacterium]|nr:polyketide synthase dehydratase domain-containing protein [Desulfoarculaceae bacterium]
MSPNCRPLIIAVQPWFKDHFFNDRVILPAVEIMEILASAVNEIDADMDPMVMSEARFSKFLEIPPERSEIAARIEYETRGQGEIRIKLLSRIQFKKITRSREHAEITFAANSPQLTARQIMASPPPKSAASVASEQIYEELVPFGPGYRTLTGPLYLSRQGAWGRLQTPAPGEGPDLQKTLGSPFPLDGAMHAACVLGQCMADFVPFPVGFTRRVIHQATKAGEQYRTFVIPVSRAADELVFDLAVFDTEGRPCETVTGLRMRDISGGRVTPPAWIRKILRDGR